MEEDKSFSFPSSEENNHGWQKVTYAKKQRKSQPGKLNSDPSTAAHNGSAEKNGVFKNLEKHGEERRRKLESQRASAIYDDEDDVPVRSKKKWGDDENEDDASEVDGNAKENNPAEKNKKEKPKKEKKLKVTVAEAAGKIDASDLAAFLSHVSGSYEGQQDIQLMRFADYFGRRFSAVSASQFPWLKLFRESALSKIAEHFAQALLTLTLVNRMLTSIFCPDFETLLRMLKVRAIKKSFLELNHNPVYSQDFYVHLYDSMISSFLVGQLMQALGSFVLWSLDSILADLAHLQTGSKGSKKGGPTSSKSTSSKSQVAIFLVLAMVLRRKPDVLINLLPRLREDSKYQGQDKLTVILWMIVQSCQGDLAVGLYLWAHHVLPILGGKSGSNPQSRDFVLQLVERILSVPKARTILINSAVRKGERLMPPAALDLLLHVTFPASSSRVKATERFEAIYPTLKEVALAGSPGSKAMKQVSQQIQTLAVKAAGEVISEFDRWCFARTPELSREATGIFLWCLTQNCECYKQWDKIYMDNIEASVAALRKLAEEWKELSEKQSSLEALRGCLKSFGEKNEKAINGGVDVSRQAFFKDADKYCKVVLRRLSRGHGCVKTVAFAIVLATGAAVMSPSLKEWDWNKFSVIFNAQQMF